MGLYDEELNELENLKYYFEGGKRQKRSRKAKGLEERAKSLSFKRSKSKISFSRRTKSESSINSKNFKNLLERILIKKFVNLSKEKFDYLVNRKKIIKKIDVEILVLEDQIEKRAKSEPSLTKSRKSRLSRLSKKLSKKLTRKIRSASSKEKDLDVFYDCLETSLKNMDITDKAYKKAIKKNYIQVKEYYKDVIMNKKYLDSLPKVIKLNINRKSNSKLSKKNQRSRVRSMLPGRTIKRNLMRRSSIRSSA